jgi:Zn-finger nucleic acid-binding protein
LGLKLNKRAATIQGVWIDARDKCGGGWLDANELAAVTRSDEREAGSIVSSEAPNHKH